jgi:hypothetical protein
MLSEEQKKERNKINNKRNYQAKKEVMLAVEKKITDKAIKERDFHHSMMNKARSIVAEILSAPRTELS